LMVAVGAGIFPTIWSPLSFISSIEQWVQCHTILYYFSLLNPPRKNLRNLSLAQWGHSQMGQSNFHPT